MFIGSVEEEQHAFDRSFFFFLVPHVDWVATSSLVQVPTHWTVTLLLTFLILLVSGGDLQISEGLLGISGLTIPDVRHGTVHPRVGTVINTDVTFLEEVGVGAKAISGSDITDVGLLLSLQPQVDPDCIGLMQIAAGSLPVMFYLLRLTFRVCSDVQVHYGSIILCVAFEEPQVNSSSRNHFLVDLSVPCIGQTVTHALIVGDLNPGDGGCSRLFLVPDIDGVSSSPYVQIDIDFLEALSLKLLFLSLIKRHLDVGDVLGHVCTTVNLQENMKNIY